MSDELEWHEFPEGVEVLTGISEVCSAGQHEDCPGLGEHEGRRCSAYATVTSFPDEV